MTSPGLPDGCLPHMLPSNSTAEETFDRHCEAFAKDIEQQAREDLYARCILPSETRSAYLDYCGDHGICSVIDYVAALEKINAREWQLTHELWQRVSWSQYTGDAA